MVDTLVLETGEAIHVGSNPSTSTKMATWVSGLNQQFAKLSFFERGTEGSNPSVVANKKTIGER